MIANTPEPPYYAVIFTNLQSTNLAGYDEMAEKMMELAAQQPGYLGVESVRDGWVSRSPIGLILMQSKPGRAMPNIWKRNS